GEHRGLAWYTIGQRQGLGIGGVAAREEAPWFVAFKDVERNALIVVQGGDHPLLYASQLSGEQLHWVSGQAPAAAPIQCFCRLRHRQPLQRCTIVGYDNRFCQVRFDVPQRAITPGQSAVFYQRDECLGGCVIADGRRSTFSGTSIHAL
ncbi:aminomethyltransferase beta-barrel domain-containing protein, partial [Halochromatium sp.]